MKEQLLRLSNWEFKGVPLTLICLKMLFTSSILGYWI